VSPRLRETSAVLEIPCHDVDANHIVGYGHESRGLEIGRAALLWETPDEIALRIGSS
jgi:hypothetical protein